MVYQRGKLYLTNFGLPFNDFGIEGSFDRYLSIPDDVNLVLAYPVIETVVGPKALLGASDGSLFVASNHAPTNQTDFRTGSLAATSSVTIVPNFTPIIMWFTCLSQTMSVDILLPVNPNPVRVWCASSANQFISLPIKQVTLNNSAASALTYWVHFFA